MNLAPATYDKVGPKFKTASTCAVEYWILAAVMENAEGSLPSSWEAPSGSGGDHGQADRQAGESPT